MSQVDFKALLSLGECNGYMRSRWFTNGQCMADIMPTGDSAIVEFRLTLPGEIIIELSNKNLNTDTKVDKEGQVIQDKFVKIDAMWLARHPIPEHIYMNLCEIGTGKNKFTSAYFGFPGQVCIRFNEADAILWHFKNNHYLV